MERQEAARIAKLFHKRTSLCWRCIDGLLDSVSDCWFSRTCKNCPSVLLSRFWRAKVKECGENVEAGKMVLNGSVGDIDLRAVNDRQRI